MVTTKNSVTSPNIMPSLDSGNQLVKDVSKRSLMVQTDPTDEIKVEFRMKVKPPRPSTAGRN